MPAPIFLVLAPIFLQKNTGYWVTVSKTLAQVLCKIIMFSRKAWMWNFVTQHHQTWAHHRQRLRTNEWLSDQTVALNNRNCNIIYRFKHWKYAQMQSNSWRDIIRRRYLFRKFRHYFNISHIETNGGGFNDARYDEAPDIRSEETTWNNLINTQQTCFIIFILSSFILTGWHNASHY